MYTELHLHTAFSFLDGSSLPEDMINQAAQLGYQSLAITDHDGVHGAMEFARMADAAGIAPITGAEITLADGSHLTLLAESRIGYGNLCRLLTNVHHGRPPLPVMLDEDDGDHGDDPDDAESDLILSHLRDYAEGLILLTGCRNGQLARLVDAGRFADAKRVLGQYIAWFGKDNVFIELQQNFVFGDTPRIARLVSLADQRGTRYVATGNVHYHHKSRHHLQDTIVAIRNRTTLDGCHSERRANAEFYLHSPQEMEDIFEEYPEAIRSTELIAARCAAFNLTTNLEYTFPDYRLDSGESQDAHLARTCWEAFADKYPDTTQKVRDRLSDELRLIAKFDLSGFFLIYRDLLGLSKEIAAELRGKDRTGSLKYLPPGRGRGSAVSSIVCYLIGLSPIDPIAHNLYVGRFLNEDLPSVPDIDIDFPREIREKMIERVYEVYGTNHAALVCAFATYRLRSAVRDVGKALGLPLADLDRIAKLSEPRGAAGLGQELERLPEYAARAQSPPWTFLIELSKQLEHFPRHVTQHVGGMVISATPLNEIIPIQPASMDGRYICQWDKDSCEDAGFIKIDFLALGMLSLVEECLDRIDTAGGKPIDLSKIDYADPDVYHMIQEGDTVGVFQVESRAQIQMLRRTKPQNLEDLIVQVAIVRPGPIVGGAVTPFVQRRVDPDYVPEYDHPDLEDVLKETLGVILYQEQVVQVAEKLAGFRAGQADQLRRAMTRKRSAEAMQAIEDEFIQGCLNRDVNPEIARTVFKKLSGFAEYGFPKSHAAAFGLLAYQSCWLKHHHPTEFLCSLLNNQPMGFYAPHVLINDGRRSGLRIKRPDINLSGYECSVEAAKTIRIGLMYVKGLQEEAADRIIDDRRRNGAFRSLADLIRRVALRPDALENLIAAGAFDDFGLQRREMLWQIGLFISPKGFTDRQSRKPAGKQLSLALPTTQDHVELPPTTSWERMTDEYRTLGMSTLYHPLQLMRTRFPKHMVSTNDLAHLPDGYRVQIPGLIVCRQRPGTAKGITFLLLEDEFGLVNIVIYPDLYERQRLEVRSTPMLTVQGTLQLANNNTNIVAERLIPMESMTFRGAASHDGWEASRDEEVDLSRVQLMRITAYEDGPRSPADLRAVTPDSHNYR
ncbi:MAG: DNA polymerase III subunit alpha [Chloroflexota bacterium]|nr:DNA polymerase III subunit alpha [Chloroflexota bacterium]